MIIRVTAYKPADNFVVQGDSGSPLLYARDNSLLGVAFGFTPDDSNVHGNFSTEFIRQHQVNAHFSVDNYRSFIRSFIPPARAA